MTPSIRSSPTSSPRGLRGRWGEFGVYLVVALLVYWPALRGGWLWDDELDVTGNAALRDLNGLWRIWFNPVGLYDYYPIKYTVQWVQWQMWGNDTLGYHLTNVVLHALSGALFSSILKRLGILHGWVGGLVFVVHPLAVESVAWITELKNTLSLPFLLLALLRYLAFEAAHRRRDLWWAVGLFLAAALCKTSVVMFPVTLLLYQLWRYERVTRPAFASTVPFFAVSLVLGLVTLWFQHHRALGEVAGDFDPIGGWLARIACAGSALAFYAWKCVLPVGLMTLYPQWQVNPPPVWLFASWLALGLIVATCWIRWHAGGRHVLFGLGWFVLHLLPVIGLVPISSQRLTWVMDHLAYVSLLGPIGLLAAATSRLRPAVLIPFAGGLVMICGGLAWRHARTFASETALWTHNVALNPKAWMAHYNLGKLAGDEGRPTSAVQHYEAAVRARPDYPEAWNNLGTELRQLGRTAEAIHSFEQAIRFQPRHFSAHNNLGAALSSAGRNLEAVHRCEIALNINPRFAPAHRNLGAIRLQEGDTAAARRHFEQALALQPLFPEAHNDLGVALAQAQQLEPAIAAFNRAITQRPKYPEALNNLGSSLRDVGRPRDALTPLRRAIALRPDYVSAHYHLGAALLESGDATAGRAALEHASNLDPAHPETNFTLGNLHATAGERAMALERYDRATSRRPQFAAAHRNAGIVLQQMGRTREAVVRFESAIAAQPDFVDALLNLAQAHESLGEMPAAIAAYERARQLRPSLPPLAP